jgi:hypothetical protein
MFDKVAYGIKKGKRDLDELKDIQVNTVKDN